MFVQGVGTLTLSADHPVGVTSAPDVCVSDGCDLFDIEVSLFVVCGLWFVVCGL